MKLKTKFQDEDFELGEVVDVAIATRPDGGFTLRGEAKAGGLIAFQYHSLKELYDNWEDVPEEPKERWFIDPIAFGNIDTLTNYSEEEKENVRELGLDFETEEEAKKAVEKLKALTILNNNGFRIIDWELDFNSVADGKIWFDIGLNTQWDAVQLLEKKPEVKEALDTLFGGEE